MTRDRAFKKLVRARMARTQERYATARAALLGELAQKSPPRARHDQTFALKRLLGEASTEAWLLGLGGGVSFQYHAFDYAGAPPLVYIGTRCNPQYAYDETFVRRVLEGLGRDVIVSTATTDAKAERELLAALEDGPVICWVGREALTGGEAYGGATPWVVVVHDVDDGVAAVEDCAAGPLEVPLERLAIARAAVKKRRLVSARPGEPMDPVDAVRAGVARCVEDLDGGVVLGGSAKNFGLAALEKWARLADDPKDTKGWPKWVGRGARLLQGMRQISAWVGAATDGAAFRGMYADFLREAREVTGDDAFDDAAARVAANAEQWRALVADVFEGDRPVLAVARATLVEAKHPESPTTFQPLEAQADAELDEAFAADFRARLAARLGALVEGERAARDTLARCVGQD